MRYCLGNNVFEIITQVLNINVHKVAKIIKKKKKKKKNTNKQVNV